MTTLAKQNVVPEPNLILIKGGAGSPARGAAGSSENSGSITQGGINPTAAAMLILYQVMAMYAKITGIDAQEQQTQIKAQKKMGKGEADAMISAGIAAGVSMIVGAAVDAAMTGIGTFITLKASSEMNTNADKTATLEQENAPAKSINEIDLNTPIPDDGTGEGLGRPRPTRDPSDPVAVRAAELERGDYTNVEGDDEINRQAVEELKKDDAKYKAFRDRLDEKMGSFEKARNTYASRSNTLSQIQSTKGNAAINAGRSANSISQGGGQIGKAQDDANASLQRSANSMAQQTDRSLANAAERAGQAQNDVQKTINAIRNTSSNV